MESLYLSFHQVVYFVLFFRHISRLSHPLISIDTVLDFLNTKSMQQNFYFGYLECKTFRYHFQNLGMSLGIVKSIFSKTTHFLEACPSKQMLGQTLFVSQCMKLRVHLIFQFQVRYQKPLLNTSHT